MPRAGPEPRVLALRGSGLGHLRPFRPVNITLTATRLAETRFGVLTPAILAD
jgi:hypothetical protein